MSARKLIFGLLAIICAATLWKVVAQGRELSDLRAEQKRLESAKPTTNSAASDTIASPPTEMPRELLQLRAEVARLSQQQRELAGARVENEKLQLQLENRRTNSAVQNATVAGYIKMSEVRWLGCNTPEDTLQSAFWAMRNRDVSKYLETIRPDVAKEIAAMPWNHSQSVEQFFKDHQLPPVFRIIGRQENDEEWVGLQVEIAPDTPATTIYFRRMGGQWKLESPL